MTLAESVRTSIGRSDGVVAAMKAAAASAEKTEHCGGRLILTLQRQTVDETTAYGLTVLPRCGSTYEVEFPGLQLL